MRRSSLGDCIEKGLLRRIPESKEKARESVKVASRWLDEAEKDLIGGGFNSSVLSSYLAMFHSARAVLFFDGFREKSHYCMARYLGSNSSTTTGSSGTTTSTARISSQRKTRPRAP